jgi:hypothetical protein
VVAQGGISSWVEANAALLAWLFALGVASLVLTTLLLPVFIVRLPEDHFLASRRDLAERRNVWQWIGLVVKNVLGVAFVLAGVAMLLLPGQGVLTILIGLLLVDFPGKRWIERRVVRRPKILAFMNRLRARRGRPPLRVD